MHAPKEMIAFVEAVRDVARGEALRPGATQWLRLADEAERLLPPKKAEEPEKK